MPSKVKQMSMRDLFWWREDKPLTYPDEVLWTDYKVLKRPNGPIIIFDPSVWLYVPVSAICHTTLTRNRRIHETLAKSGSGGVGGWRGLGLSESGGALLAEEDTWLLGRLIGRNYRVHTNGLHYYWLLGGGWWLLFRHLLLLLRLLLLLLV